MEDQLLHLANTLFYLLIGSIAVSWCIAIIMVLIVAGKHRLGRRGASMDTDQAILARLECIIELLATMHPKNPDVSLGLEGYSITWGRLNSGLHRTRSFDGDGRIFVTGQHIQEEPPPQ
jgi:hypothetical protein